MSPQTGWRPSSPGINLPPQPCLCHAHGPAQRLPGLCPSEPSAPCSGADHLPTGHSAVRWGFSGRQGLGVPDTGGGADIPEVGGAMPCSSHIEGGGPARWTSGCPPPLLLPGGAEAAPPAPWGSAPLLGVTWTSAQVAEAWGPGGSLEGPTCCGDPRPHPRPPAPPVVLAQVGLIRPALWGKQ